MEKSEFLARISNHRLKVNFILTRTMNDLNNRRLRHDLSKLDEPELSTFLNNPLESLEYGTPEYDAKLNEMLESGALEVHYHLNRHHPEHFLKGINGMNLIDLMEMVADWMAASAERNKTPDLEYAARRFRIEPQLLEIISNTITYLSEK